MTTPSDEARVFIRASRMTPLTYLCAWALFLGVLFVGAGTMPFVAVGGVLILFAVLSFVAHSSLAGVRLDATGVSARGIFRLRRLEWVDVRSVRSMLRRTDTDRIVGSKGRGVGPARWLADRGDKTR